MLYNVEKSWEILRNFEKITVGSANLVNKQVEIADNKKVIFA